VARFRSADVMNN